MTVRTFDKLDIPRRRITGITMPGFGTTGRTYGNALNLMRTLGVDMREIGIKAACEQHFNDIGLDPSDRSTTYELSLIHISYLRSKSPDAVITSHASKS